MQGKVCGKKRHTKTEIRSEISELICGRIAAGENYNLTRDIYIDDKAYVPEDFCTPCEK